MMRVQAPLEVRHQALLLGALLATQTLVAATLAAMEVPAHALELDQARVQVPEQAAEEQVLAPERAQAAELALALAQVPADPLVARSSGNHRVG